MSEQEAMELNTQGYVDQYEQARSSLEQNYGVSMDESEWEIFWRAFGDADVVSKFGSDTIVYIGEEVRNDPNLTMRQAARIAAQTLQEGGFESEDKLRIEFNKNVNAYKKMRWGKGSGHLSDKEAMKMLLDKEAMEMLFK